MDVPSLVDINKFKVPELKSQLSEAGLSVAGNKPILAQRLLEYLTRQADGDTGNEELVDGGGDDEGEQEPMAPPPQMHPPPMHPPPMLMQQMQPPGMQSGPLAAPSMTSPMPLMAPPPMAPPSMAPPPMAPPSLAPPPMAPSSMAPPPMAPPLMAPPPMAPTMLAEDGMVLSPPRSQNDVPRPAAMTAPFGNLPGSPSFPQRPPAAPVAPDADFVAKVMIQQKMIQEQQAAEDQQLLLEQHRAAHMIHQPSGPPMGAPSGPPPGPPLGHPPGAPMIPISGPPPGMMPQASIAPPLVQLREADNPPSAPPGPLPPIRPMMTPRPPINTPAAPPPLLVAPLRAPIPPPIQRAPQLKGPALEGANDPNAPLKLPSALENVLTFKDIRAKEVGIRSADAAITQGPAFDVDEDEAESVTYYQRSQAPAPTAKQVKPPMPKKKKKKRKTRGQRMKEMEVALRVRREESHDGPSTAGVEVEYISEDLGLDPKSSNYRIFHKIFEAFKISEKEEEEKKEEKGTAKEDDKADKEKEKKGSDDDDDDDDEKGDEEQKISKKKLKKMTRLSVAELKQLVSRPDVVEMHDVTARDPKLLVHLKSTRNSVPVPRHWCFKRKYLQGKRGIEKPPFDLPDFIKKTGIMEMRQALQDKETEKSLKSKMREKVRPKLGKIDIDYQKLHDAFFKWQTKPKMSIHGDLYYEGKEFETRLKEKKPGVLSDDLRIALGMPVGPNAEKFPPPWLISMQRYGPPPSYLTLKIPGLNAPIPEECSFGYHAGGWGKPPVDERGKPLYGDVFGLQAEMSEEKAVEEEIDRSHWGELESESSEESESESEEEEEEGQAAPEASGLVTPGPEGMITPSGLTSMPVGIETPDGNIQLRKTQKANIEAAMEAGDERPPLYQVLPEKRSAVGGAMMGSSHVYDIATAGAAASAARPAPAPAGGERDRGDIEVALNPEELDLDPAEMAARYEQRLREQQHHLAKDRQDLSDMVAEHAAKQKKKRKAQADKDDGKGRESGRGTGPATKKYKEFKF